MNLLLCSVAIPAIGAQSEQTSQSSAVPPPPAATHAPFVDVQHAASNVFQQADPDAVNGGSAPDEQGEQGQNRLKFVTGEQMNELAQRFKERLTDPAQRVALRAEQRAALVSQNTSVGRLVGLDPVMEQKLIELLTDEQMERLDQMYVQRLISTDLQKIADEMTQRMTALRDLLGDEKLERFQDFESKQSGRHWVTRLSAGLAPADKLQPDQEDRLTALKQEQFRMSALGPWRAFRHPIGPLLSFEDMQRDSQRQTLLANEESWRRRQVEHRALEQEAATFLTSTQLAALTRYQALEQDNLRRYVEFARAEAGMDPQIPDTPEEVEEIPQPIEAQLQVEVRLTVNRELTTVTRTVRSGESFTFRAAQGLIVEATLILYEDDWIDVHLNYSEEGTTGQRRLPGSMISTAQARQPDGAPGVVDGGGTVVSGRKGYAIESTVIAQVL